MNPNIHRVQVKTSLTLHLGQKRGELTTINHDEALFFNDYTLGRVIGAIAGIFCDKPSLHDQKSKDASLDNT